MVINGNTNKNTLINTIDLFATITEIASINNKETNDSKSLKWLLEETPITARNYTFTELRKGNNQTDFTIGNITHKCLLIKDAKESFFDLSQKPLIKS